MRVVIITIAGISSRFNEGIPEEEKKHKIIYYEKDRRNTLLYHLLNKCLFADRIVLVGGNKYDDVEKYCNELPESIREKIDLVYNDHYADLASGYSLYVGLKHIFQNCDDIEEILFAEGDLDIDGDSFKKIELSDANVVTFSYEPIYANKSVVLYRDNENQYRYAFNSNHGLLKIETQFSCMLNSGQIWKFKNIEKLKIANEEFYKQNIGGTNLRIIQSYIDSVDNDSIELIGLKRWTNCNTREDYRKILAYWEADA